MNQQDFLEMCKGFGYETGESRETLGIPHGYEYMGYYPPIHSVIWNLKHRYRKDDMVIIGGLSYTCERNEGSIDYVLTLIEEIVFGKRICSIGTLPEILYKRGLANTQELNGEEIRNFVVEFDDIIADWNLKKNGIRF